jgi:heme-degrading monooxygenase HmoA
MFSDLTAILRAFAAAPMRALAAMMPMACMLAGCTVSTPYREGMAVQAAFGAETEIVAITEATLAQDLQSRSAFWEGVRRVEAELPSQAGLLGYSLRQELFGSRVWTMTVWASEADLQRFTASPAHRSAVQASYGALTDIRFARIIRARNSPRLTWSEAIAVLEAGRRRQGE